jgi:uncharacterized protein (TIGR02145 family)
MTKTKGFLLTAGIVLATTFTLSCSSDGGDPSPGTSSDGGISSSLFASSSSSVGYAGSYGSVSDDAGKAYKTVAIGIQTWMAENLDYDPGSGSSVCYDDDPGNCTLYGRLYDWATAMALDPSCNASSCSNQIQDKHKGICPSGWHIPSDEEWSVLVDYAGGSSKAGAKLKATGGWYNNGNGTDDYGFSALPGGFGDPGDDFGLVGWDGYWWSASEAFNSRAYLRYMDYNGEDVEDDNYDIKSRLFSVRCIKD